MKFEIVHDKSHLFIYLLLFAKDMAHLRTILHSNVKWLLVPTEQKLTYTN